MIHPTAIVEEGAQIAADAEIGPFCTVGGKAVIGSGTRLISHVSVQGATTLGSSCTVHPFVSLGGPLRTSPTKMRIRPAQWGTRTSSGNT